MTRIMSELPMIFFEEFTSMNPGYMKIHMFIPDDPFN